MSLVALAGAEAQLQIAAVEDVKIGQVGILVGAVGLQTIAFVSGWPPGRAKYWR